MSDQNEQQPQDALDALLFDFGQNITTESQINESARTQLIERVIRAIDEKPLAMRCKSMTIRRFFTVAAVCVSVLMVVFAVTWRTPDRVINVVTIPTDFAERHRDQMQAVVEHEQTFGLPLAWYVERGNQVRFELAIDKGNEVTVSKHQAVFAELRVEKAENIGSVRKTQDKTLFLMTRNEQPVELNDDHSHRPQLLFWLCPVDENLFAYELAMCENNGMQFAGETVGLIEADKSTKTLLIEQNGVEYHVYLQIHASTT